MRDPSPSAVRQLAQQALSRTSGSPLVEGNTVRLLLDARENFPAWLAAIAHAKRYVHFETYIFADDSVGRMFADAFLARVRAGVPVRVVYDWMGCLGKASGGFWRKLQEAGVEVRCYNPPRADAPLAILRRDHRKALTVDGEIAFVSGLGVSAAWLGDPDRGIDPWRDAGVEIRGPAVRDVESGFRAVWAGLGEPLEDDASEAREDTPGEAALRVVLSEPLSPGMLRIDQLIATLAAERLWLTDPYYAGTPSYVHALRAAAEDGVDVRLLVPGTTDFPMLQLLSRVGYRSLLEAGVRVFEWNGTMMHAKTAVADARWARVGSTNLNLASWIGNYELDVLVEDRTFARSLERTYLDDLNSSTELVLDERRKLRSPGRSKARPSLGRRGRGTAGRAAAGALRIGNVVGGTLSDQRTLRAVDPRSAMTMGLVLLALATLLALFPKVLAYPVILVLVWAGLGLLVRAFPRG